MKKLTECVALLIWTYLMIVLLPFLMIYAIHILLPYWKVISKLASQTPDITTLFMMAVFFPGIGALLFFLSKKTKPVIIWRLPLNQLLADFTVSLLLSYTLWRFFSVFYSWKYLGLFFLFLFFVFYLPQMFVFLSNVSFEDFNNFFFIRIPSVKELSLPKINYLNFFYSLLKGMVVIIVTIIFILGINKLVAFSNQKIIAYKKQQAYLSLLPHINKKEPYLVYQSTKIILWGKNFGLNDKVVLTNAYNQFEKINVEYWSDNKIIFQIPLHWRLGEVDVWIEKPITWEGKIQKVKSNIVKVKLLKRVGPWDTDDDAYFEQLKNLDKETLEINGYITPTPQPKKK